MSKPIELWPPGGGDSIKVSPCSVDRLVAQGWADKQPARKKKAKSKEDLNNGES